MKRLVTLAAAAAAALAAPSVAQAHNYQQALGSAIYFSAVDCPHHRFGVCKAREARVWRGLGKGRWEIETRGWECLVFEPCALAKSRGHARWNYRRVCVLEHNGKRHRCRNQGDW